MSNRTKGTICILLAALSFALMSTFVRLAGDIPSLQKAFFRKIAADGVDVEIETNGVYYE